MSSSLLLPNEVPRASESLSLQVARAIRMGWAERTVRGFVFFHRA